MFILRFLIVAVATAMVSSFLSSHLSVRVKTALNGDVFYDNSCEDRLKDPNGRCPGEPGFQPVVLPLKKDQKDFKSFQAAQKAKKEAEAAAKKK